MQDLVSLDELNQETSVAKAEWTKANSEEALGVFFTGENKEKETHVIYWAWNVQMKRIRHCKFSSSIMNSGLEKHEVQQGYCSNYEQLALV